MDAACRHRAAACAVLLGILVCAGAHAQQGKPLAGSQPQQQAAAQEPGQISGHIYRADTKEPLDKATVTLRPITQRSRAYDDSQTARTDGSGAYLFTDLPPGNYILEADRNGFATKRYGQEGRNNPSRPLTLNPSQSLEKIDLALDSAGVISGTVIDEDSEPVFRIRVAALQPRYSRGGHEILEPRASVTTDDQGNFRLVGLAAGFYYVQVNGLNGGNPRFGLNHGASYRETYYPEAQSPEDAQRIRVVGEAEVRGLHIAVTTQAVHTISGRVADTSGASERIFYQLFIYKVGADAMVVPGNGIRPDGSFVIHGLPQGDYTIGVRAMYIATDQVLDSGYGTAVVHVSDTDIRTDIAVGQLARVRGTATMVMNPNPSSLASLGIRLLPVGPTTQGNLSSTLAEDGTFNVKDIAPGEYTFMAFGPQNLAYLQRVQCGGTDYTVQPLTIGAGDELSDCVLTLANDTGILSGQVMDGETPMPNLVVVAIPQLRSLRKTPSYTVTAKTDSSGKFQLSGIIPGDYEIFAVAPDADQPYYALDFPERNQDSAQRVTIKPRETQTVTLKPTSPQ